MSIEYYDIEQGTTEWHRARLGIMTASNVSIMITPTGKIAKNAKVAEYAHRLAAERINGFHEETPTTFAMNRGHFQECLARNLYSEKIAEVKEVGFVTREIDGVKIGASPDGLVGLDGGIEIKSKMAKFQIKTFLDGTVPPEHMMQIQATLLVTGRQWWDYVQYSNGMKLFVMRVLPDHGKFALITEAAVRLEEIITGAVAAYENASRHAPLAEHVPFLDDDNIEMEVTQ